MRLKRSHPRATKGCAALAAPANDMYAIILLKVLLRIFMTITANEIKTNGVSIFDKFLNKFDELIINVRGKDKYVVLDIQRYKEFREYELDIAHMKVMQDIENGDYKTQTASQHIDELTSEL